MMKKIYMILMVIGVVMMALIFLGKMMSSPLSKEKIISKIKKKLNRTIKKNDFKNIVLTIKSDEQSFNETFTAGDATGLGVHQPYHVASVGKTFTATLVYMLAEKGQLNLSDAITDYLSDDVVEGLYVYENIDYKDVVTIENLLNHTSGIGDYFEDPVITGKDMKTLLRDDLDHFWTHLELIDFTRNHQETYNKPGVDFHYSDTGYVLLGLIVESITGQSFHQFLDDQVFTPLEMNDSYMMYISEPRNRKEVILPVLLKGVDVSTTNALSVDWTGGGIVSTNDDLIKFCTALNNGQLINETSYQEMTTFEHEMIKGIHYSTGMAEIRFEEFFFLLKGMNSLQGGIGATGSYMLYDTKTATYITGNFGSLDAMEKSVQTLISILQIYQRLEL